MGETRIAVPGDPAQLRALHSWLVQDGALRGRVRALPAPADALQVSLVRGGVATILSAAVIAWLRERPSDDLRVILTPDGARDPVTLSAHELRAPDERGLDRRVASLATHLADR